MSPEESEKLGYLKQALRSSNYFVSNKSTESKPCLLLYRKIDGGTPNLIVRSKSVKAFITNAKKATGITTGQLNEIEANDKANPVTVRQHPTAVLPTVLSGAYGDYWWMRD